MRRCWILLQIDLPAHMKVSGIEVLPDNVTNGATDLGLLKDIDVLQRHF